MNTKSVHDKIDKPFKYGEIDCVRLIWDFYGDKLPKKWKDFDLDTYYKKVDYTQVEILEEVIKDLFVRVDKPKFGCLVTHPKIKGFVGIYMNNNIITFVSVEEGVKTMPLINGCEFWEVK